MKGLQNVYTSRKGVTTDKYRNSGKNKHVDRVETSWLVMGDRLEWDRLDRSLGEFW